MTVSPKGLSPYKPLGEGVCVWMGGGGVQEEGGLLNGSIFHATWQLTSSEQSELGREG